MVKRFVLLVLASAIATPALADDLIPAYWADDGYGGRIMPTDQDPCNPLRYMGPSGLWGTTYSEWTYDDPCNLFNGDPPESSWFVSHPDFEDPARLGGGLEDYFSAQFSGDNGDPCMPIWYDILSAGRQGAANFAYGSWDINNFTDAMPIKCIWIQITYFNGTVVPSEVEFSAGYIEDGDPCKVFVGAELVNSQVLEDGWIHEVFHVDLPVFPSYEWIEGGAVGGPFGGVQLDQIIIETYNWVPEPATMLLFGLGGLMIRRRR